MCTRNRVHVPDWTLLRPDMQKTWISLRARFYVITFRVILLNFISLSKDYSDAFCLCFLGLHFEIQQGKHHNSVWNLFKVNRKDTRTTSLTLFGIFHCELWTDFTQKRRLVSWIIIYITHVHKRYSKSEHVFSLDRQDASHVLGLVSVI